MKQLFNRNSLFWKIFLAFWLANVLVIIATSYFTFEIRHANDLYEEKKKFAQSMGKEMIRNTRLDPRYYRKHRRHVFKARLENDAGEVIVDTLPRSENHKFKNNPNAKFNHTRRHPPDRFDITDDQGKPYRLFLPARLAPPGLREHFQRLLVLRLLLLLIASGVVSFFLSRMIIGPLVRLGEQTASVRGGGELMALDPALLKRKDEIGDLARGFDSAMWAMSSIMDSRRALLHDVSHEMRAPLARLAATIGLLEQEGGQVDRVTRLQKECEAMNRLVDQVLTYSRIESTTAVLESIDAVGVLAEQIENVCYEFKHHDVVFVGVQEEVKVFADQRLLQAAISNLLRNACQHTKVGTAVRACVRQQGAWVVISVEDNGTGVDDDQLEEIFKPFYRHHNAGNNVGLGLNIVQRAVQHMGGTVKVSNRSAGGLKFEIRISAGE